MSLIKLVPPGEKLPAFFGATWYDFNRDYRICLPIPFNIIAALGYIIYWFLKYPFRRLLLWIKKHEWERGGWGY